MVGRGELEQGIPRTLQPAGSFPEVPRDPFNRETEKFRMWGGAPGGDCDGFERSREGLETENDVTSGKVDQNLEQVQGRL